MQNVCIILGYDGTAYNGFQMQPNRVTVQDELQKAIYQLTGEQVKIHASGRTDAGVHARGQVVNFITGSSIPEHRWCLALNSRLPDDIVCYRAKFVSPDFHSRYGAKRKTYRYTININRYPDVFQRSYQFHHPTKLDLTAMRKALPDLIGEHDFTTFCTMRKATDNHVRTIFDARLEEEPGTRPADPELGLGVHHLYITGSGFLYNMVRIIAGTLIEIGEGKKRFDSIPSLLAARDRHAAGPTAMAHGLMLWNVEYENF